MTDVTLKIRQVTEASELRLVINAWLKSMRREFPEMRDDDYYAAFHDRVEAAIVCNRIVAVETKRIVAAFLVHTLERNLLMAYTKKDFRRMGLQTALLEHIGFDETWMVGALHTSWQVAWKRKHGVRFVPWFAS